MLRVQYGSVLFCTWLHYPPGAFQKWSVVSALILLRIPADVDVVLQWKMKSRKVPGTKSDSSLATTTM